MAGLSLTREQYDQLVEAFRETPGDIGAARKQAGVHHNTAKRAWHEGWPDRGWLPISKLLSHEQKLVRAQLAEAQAKILAAKEEAKEELARADAIEVRAQEAQMVRASRSNILGLYMVIGKTLKACIRRAEGLEKDLQQLGPKDAIQAIKHTSSMVKQASEAAKLSIEMERILLGEPTEIIGVNMRDMSVDECLHTLSVSQRAMARMKERGLIDASMLPPGEEESPPKLGPGDQEQVSQLIEPTYSAESIVHGSEIVQDGEP